MVVMAETLRDRMESNARGRVGLKTLNQNQHISRRKGIARDLFHAPRRSPWLRLSKLAVVALMLPLVDSTMQPVYFTPAGGSVFSGDALRVWSNDQSVSLSYSYSPSGGSVHTMPFIRGGTDVFPKVVGAAWQEIAVTATATSSSGSETTSATATFNITNVETQLYPPESTYRAVIGETEPHLASRLRRVLPL